MQWLRKSLPNAAGDRAIYAEFSRALFPSSQYNPNILGSRGLGFRTSGLGLVVALTWALFGMEWLLVLSLSDCVKLAQC